MAKRARSAVRAVPADDADGMLAGIVDRIFEDPARSGGLMVVAMTATAIVCNALFLQHAPRPAPLFATRSAPAAVPLPNPAPVVAADNAATQSAPAATLLPPLPRPSPATIAAATEAKPAPAPLQVQPPAPAQAAPQAQTQAQPSAALVTEIQRGLARLGLYTGPIDGKPGARTSAAIAKYEEAAGINITGQPTPELLQALRHPLAAPTAKPAPDPIANKLDQSQTTSVVNGAAERQAAAAKVAAAQKAAADASAAAATQAKAAATYRTVQTALNRIGYGPVPVDGTANKATVDAIRGFELDNGLPVSGEPSDALIQRLVSIGAIRSN